MKIEKKDIRKNCLFLRGTTGNNLKVEVSEEHMNEILDILFEDQEFINVTKVEIEENASSNP